MIQPVTGGSVPITASPRAADDFPLEDAQGEGRTRPDQPTPPQPSSPVQTSQQPQTEHAPDHQNPANAPTAAATQKAKTLPPVKTATKQVRIISMETLLQKYPKAEKLLQDSAPDFYDAYAHHHDFYMQIARGGLLPRVNVPLSKKEVIHLNDVFVKEKERYLSANNASTPSSKDIAQQNEIAAAEQTKNAPPPKPGVKGEEKEIKTAEPLGGNDPGGEIKKTVIAGAGTILAGELLGGSSATVEAGATAAGAGATTIGTPSGTLTETTTPGTPPVVVIVPPGALQIGTPPQVIKSGSDAAELGIWTSLTTGLGESWHGFTTSMSETWAAFSSDMRTGWDEFSTSIGEMLNNMKETVAAVNESYDATVNAVTKRVDWLYEQAKKSLKDMFQPFSVPATPEGIAMPPVLRKDNAGEGGNSGGPPEDGNITSPGIKFIDEQIARIRGLIEIDEQKLQASGLAEAKRKTLEASIRWLNKKLRGYVADRAEHVRKLTAPKSAGPRKPDKPDGVRIPVSARPGLAGAIENSYLYREVGNQGRPPFANRLREGSFIEEIARDLRNMGPYVLKNEIDEPIRDRLAALIRRLEQVVSRLDPNGRNYKVAELPKIAKELFDIAKELREFAGTL